MKFYSFVISMLIVASYVNGQEVSKKLIVEHFTNSKCSVCASRNPGFYTALNKRPDVLHIAYHPSSPYSSCLFSTQNKAENDARTRFYDVYGGTPTFVINGNVTNANDVSNSTVYAQYDNKKSSLKISVALKPGFNDSINVVVEVVAVSTHNLSNLSLYVPMIEDTVFYNAPNGESQHYDVFRKSFTGNNPLSFIVPNFGESSYVFSKSIASNQLWDLDRLSAVAIIGDSDNKVVQAEQSILYNPNTVSTTVNTYEDGSNLFISPNPAIDVIQLKMDESISFLPYEIYSSSGLLTNSGSTRDRDLKIDVSFLPIGVYFVKVGSRIASFVKQ